MAERGAHITSTLQAMPSIFEVVAQDALANAVRPALQRICLFLATYSPSRFGWLQKSFEETYLLFNSFLQYHYLKKNGSSFAESFYGLQRVPFRQVVTKNSAQLPRKEKILSLLCLVIIPYLVTKFGVFSTMVRLDRHNNTQTSLNLLMRLESLLNFIWQISSLAQCLAYIAGWSSYHSPLLRLAQVKLVYHQEPARSWTDLWQCALNADLSLDQVMSLLGSALTHSIEVGAFFIQFLQWWHYVELKGILVYPIPEPLKTNSKANKDNCPICLKKRTNETVLPTSGYVYCYRCIVSALKETGKCPMSKLQSSPEELIRLYPDST